MGQWAIHIEGIGCHHNGPDVKSDADKIFFATVAQLKESGQTLTHASFGHGGRDEIAVNIDDTIEDLL